jgi:hypothetical protein
MRIAPPPRNHGPRFVYGLVQPLLGARLLASDRELLRAALIPAGLLAAFCALVALIDAHSFGEGVRRFYTTFAFLAPLPSVVLAHHYARLAVLARRKLGFAPAEPCLEPMGTMIRRAIKQTILVAIALAPIIVLLRAVPLVGRGIVHAIGGVWALHWIVVEAFDSARFLRPGQTLAELDAHAENIRKPWFVRAFETAADHLPIGKRILRRFARFCDRMAMPWREEIALVEEHPSLMLGFALTTAAFLAIPVVNLLFRPIVQIGAAHVLGQLETMEPESPVVPPPVASAVGP